MSYNSNRARNFQIGRARLILKLPAPLLPELYSTRSNYLLLSVLHKTSFGTKANNNMEYHGVRRYRLSFKGYGKRPKVVD